MALRSTGDPTLRWAAFGLAEAATIATMGLRMLAGAHSWEDVLGGFFIGSTTGLAMGYVHPMMKIDRVDTVAPGSAAAPAAWRAPPTLMSWGGSF